MTDPQRPSSSSARSPTRRRTIVAGLALVLALSGASGAIAQVAKQGKWSDTVDWPMVAIHAAVVPDGKVITFGSTPQGGQGALDFDVWDPRRGLGVDAHTTKPNVVDVDSFCAATVIQPWNGQLMIVGGGNGSNDDTTFRAGRFSWKTQTLDTAERAAYRRWYATTTTLPDGRILIQGGGPYGANHTNSSDIAEIYSSGQGWRTLGGTFVNRENNGGDEERWYYPRMWPVAGNKAFVLTGKVTYEISYDGNGANQNMRAFDRPNWGATSSAVMYAPKKVMQVGGGAKWADVDQGPGSKNATLIDLSNPKYPSSETAPMQYGRHWPNATVLPTGDVLVTGGSEGNSRDHYSADTVAYAAEIWSPKTGKWTTLASPPGRVPRLYHSSAVLLPDGRVFTGGGGVPGPIYGKSAEVFTPPYLFDASGAAAPRPVVTTEPGIVKLGQSFDVKVTETRPTARFTIVKTGATTHSLNMDQRFLEMAFSGGNGAYRLTMTSDAIDATPGYYMLFALDDRGVPSIAKMLRIPSPTGDGGEAPPTGQTGETAGTDGGGSGSGDGSTATASADGTSGPLVAMHSNMCLSVQGGSAADGARLMQVACNGSAIQNWTWKAANGGSLLVNAQTNKCVDVYNFQTADGAALVQWGCNSTDNQIWKAAQGVNGGQTLTSKQSGKCIDVSGVSTQQGAQVWQWTCNGQANQSWKVQASASADNSGAGGTQIGNEAAKVASAADGTTLVVNSRTGVVWRSNSGANWTALGNRVMREVATGGANRIYAIGSDAGVYRWNGTDWVFIGPNARTIAAASDGTVVVTNPANEIWVKAADDYNGNWNRIGGAAKKVVTIAANRFWSIGLDGNVYRWQGNGNWTRTGVDVSDIAVSSDGGVAVINKETGLAWRKATEDAAWARAGGKALQVSAQTSGLWVTVDPNNNVYRVQAN